jgi:phosphatidate cytidylyltransferase
LAFTGVAGMAGLFGLCLTGYCARCVFDKKRDAMDLLCAVFVFVYPLFFYALLLLIARYPVFALSRVALLLCVAAPSAADMAAFFIGSLFGRHKLCPEISPHKTVEGSIAGFIGGLLGGVATYYLQPIWGAAVPLWHLALLGTLFGGLGQVGDLFASSLKRWAGVKDYGKLLPGHGGVMDRMDSILMCAPAVFVYLYCLS